MVDRYVRAKALSQFVIADETAVRSGFIEIPLGRHLHGFVPAPRAR